MLIRRDCYCFALAAFLAMGLLLTFGCSAKKPEKATTPPAPPTGMEGKVNVMDAKPAPGPPP